jgi:prevent-host-death family protein
MLEKTISAGQAKKQFGRLLEEVSHQSQSVVIEQSGQAMAVLIPVEQYRQLKERRAAFFAMIDDVQQRTSQAPPEELEAAIAEATSIAKADDNLP